MVVGSGRDPQARTPPNPIEVETEAQVPGLHHANLFRQVRFDFTFHRPVVITASPVGLTMPRDEPRLLGQKAELFQVLQYRLGVPGSGQVLGRVLTADQQVILLEILLRATPRNVQVVAPSSPKPGDLAEIRSRGIRSVSYTHLTLPTTPYV